MCEEKYLVMYQLGDLDMHNMENNIHMKFLVSVRPFIHGAHRDTDILLVKLHSIHEDDHKRMYQEDIGPSSTYSARI